MSKKIIEIKGLQKQFTDQIILDNVSFDVFDGEFLTLLGPSGCGKTTLLRMLAGFETPDAGQLLVNGQDILRTPPQARPINTVFQSYALFPHMNVFDNVAFGLRNQNKAKQDIKTRVENALAMVKLSNFAKRKPHQLSGGQQQRVAIARAVVNEPNVLLLDEPLSSLDYQLRKNMQFELKNLQQQLGITFILVTHDQEEALTMADRIAVMHNGRIQQIGTPREVYEEPANLTIAMFIGQTNIFDVTVLEANHEHLVIKIEGKPFLLKNRKGFQKGDEIHLLLRPEDCHVWGVNEVFDPSQMTEATVKQFIYKGSTVDLVLELESGKLISASEFFDEDDETLEYTLGEKVWIEWIPGWEVLLPKEC